MTEISFAPTDITTQAATEWSMHREKMRLESVRLALDTVVAGSDDDSGHTTAKAVLLIADHYLEYIINGPQPAKRGRK